MVQAITQAVVAVGLESLGVSTGRLAWGRMAGSVGSSLPFRSGWSCWRLPAAALVLAGLLSILPVGAATRLRPVVALRAE